MLITIFFVVFFVVFFLLFGAGIVGLIFELRNKSEEKEHNKAEIKQFIFVVVVLLLLTPALGFGSFKSIEEHKIYKALPMVDFTEVKIIDFDKSGITYLYEGADGELIKGTKTITDIKIGEELKLTKKQDYDFKVYDNSKSPETLYITREILSSLSLNK